MRVFTVVTVYRDVTGYDKHAFYALIEIVLAISLDIMLLTMLSLGILNIPLAVPVYQSAA